MKVRRVLKDVTGQTFNRLSVIKRVLPNQRGNVMWLCKCICGKYTNVSYVNLKHQRIKSCGCYRKEIRGTSNLRHGCSNTKIYKIWEAMLKRCKNPQSDINKRYYHRGIRVCKEWKDFINFKKWSDKNGYKNGLSIERKDNDLGYNPQNCCWIPRKQQAWNTKRSIKYNNECASEASRRLGGSDLLVSQRIRRGWSVEKSFTTPA